MKLFIVITVTLCIGCRAPRCIAQNRYPTVPRVLAMQAQPSPFHIRNWRSVTVAYLQTIFNSHLKGDLLPAVRWPVAGSDAPFLPSYLGGDGTEAINYIAAVVSGRLVGLHMSHFEGHNLVKFAQVFLNDKAGVFANNPHSEVPGSFWYELLPNVLAFQMYALRPSTKDSLVVERRIADQWVRVCQILSAGGTHMPNFNYTGFEFNTMSPDYNGKWREPDGAAGVAWLEYMAWRQFHDAKYLHCAVQCIEFLEHRVQVDDPLYETLLPYGVLVATRLNAETGCHFDIQKLVNWCFSPGGKQAARIGWGVLSERAGRLSLSGLVGSATDSGGYAFAMNTFEWAGALTPMVRYDTRYAAIIGKWMLNLVNNARLFYSNSLPAANQDCSRWCFRYDRSAVLPYEGVRLHPAGNEGGPSPFATGDAVGSGGRSNICLYGGSHVGILGVLVHRTTVDEVLRLNLLGTDYLCGRAYPTSLFYNPYSKSTSILLTVVHGPQSFYDCVEHRFIALRVKGKVRVRLLPRQAIVLVRVPSFARHEVVNNRLLVNSIVIDWNIHGSKALPSTRKSLE